MRPTTSRLLFWGCKGGDGRRVVTCTCNRNRAVISARRVVWGIVLLSEIPLGFPGHGRFEDTVKEYFGFLVHVLDLPYSQLYITSQPHLVAKSAAE